MVTSLLYYRTPSTKSSDVADPRSLPSAQVLEFTQPDRVLEGVSEIYDNLIVKQVSVNQTGVRRLFNRDDGMKRRDFTIDGRLEKGSLTANVNKLIDFRTRLQRDDDHPHGIIGFLSGNSTNFSIDPNATAGTPATLGLMIGNTTIGYTGRIFRRLMFRATLHFGGEHETVSVV